MNNIPPVLIAVIVMVQVSVWIAIVFHWCRLRRAKSLLQSRQKILAKINCKPGTIRTPQPERCLTDQFLGVCELLAYFVIPASLYLISWVNEFPASSPGVIVLLLVWNLIPVGTLFRLMNKRDLVILRTFNTNLELRKCSYEQVQV